MTKTTLGVRLGQEGQGSLDGCVGLGLARGACRLPTALHRSCRVAMCTHSYHCIQCQCGGRYMKKNVSPHHCHTNAGTLSGWLPPSSLGTGVSPLSPVPTALPSWAQHRRSQALFSKWKPFVSWQSPNMGLKSPNKTSCHLNYRVGLATRAETLLVPTGPIDWLIADSW